MPSVVFYIDEEYDTLLFTSVKVVCPSATTLRGKTVPLDLVIFVHVKRQRFADHDRSSYVALSRAAIHIQRPNTIEGI
jgi:hypothetical protein